MPKQFRDKPITIGKCKTWEELETVLKKIPSANKQGPITCIDTGGCEIYPSLLKVGKFDDIYLREET